jgi:drug/metabolite transporter (DMT)-like permease
VFYGLGYLMLSAAIHFIGKTMTALLSNLEPLVSIISAALILGETMSGVQYFGGLVLMISLVTGDWMTRRRANQ